ncbi:MAG: ABC transporter substrate-binding protein, partial [Desulfobacterales bacterium]|nr:ABC transporter substrate-binding protein [Desulfobacterales bacterium]
IMVGINVESQSEDFPKAVGGGADYVFTMNTYAKNIEATELTKPFLDSYISRYKQMPSYTADTYSMIKHILVPVIEETGSLDSEKIIPIMEEKEFLVPSGIIKWTQNHDLTWGPGYLTSLGVQWQKGELLGVWPNGWVPAPGAPAITYKGMVPIKIPPALYEKYKK